MKQSSGFSLLDRAMEQYAKEVGLHKEAKRILQEYEDSYRQTSANLLDLANNTIVVWEQGHTVLKQHTEEDIKAESISSAVERLESFILEIKAALTQYRRNKSEASLRFAKAAIDLTQWHKGEIKSEVVQEVKVTETLVSGLVKDANGRASTALQYLRDIHNEAEATYKALQTKLGRTTNISSSSEKPDNLLQAVHSRLAQAGKVSIRYNEFSRLLQEGKGSFNFAGKQNDLAYLLLFLNRNGFAENWRGLNLSYLKNGVPTKTTAQGIKETQKKLSIRTEPELKLLLGGLKEGFPELVVP